MVESVGKMLQGTRLKRGISVEEAAHATKLRPDKILALENDDYARFGSNAYGKGFLQIYSRYLGVDVSAFARTLDSSNPISVADYQYLTNGVVQRESERETFSFGTRKQTPSLVPLVVFVLLLLGGFFGYQTYVNWQRVAGESTSDAVPKQDATPADPEPAVVATRDAELPREAIAPMPEKPPASSETPAAPAPAIPVATETRPIATPIPMTAALVTNEVLVEPLKKTWVVVRRDDPKSAPVFEDFIYPDTQPLKVRGARIFIEAREPASIVIRKNGAAIAYAPGTEIR